MSHAAAFVQWVEASPAIYRGGWTLLHSCWEFAAVAGLLAAVLRLLEHASSHLRYLVSTTALGLMVALPVFTFETLTVSPPRPALSPSGSLASRALSGSANHRSTADVHGPMATRALDSPVFPVQIALISSWLARVAAPLSSMLRWTMLAWAVGVLVLSLWHLGGWIATQRLRSLGTSAVSPALVTLLSGLATRVGLTRPVRIAKSTLVQIPIVIGSLRPLILVPASVLAGLPAAHLEAILAHELAHIRRHDYLINLLQALVETLLFYHPAVWWVSRQIRQERENCCDDIAIGICGDRRLYAEALVSVEELRAPESSLVLAATGGGGSMFARIQRLVGRPRRPRRQSASLAAVFLSLGFLLVPLLLQDISAQEATAGRSATTAPAKAAGFDSIFDGLSYMAGDWVTAPASGDSGASSRWELRVAWTAGNGGMRFETLPFTEEPRALGITGWIGWGRAKDRFAVVESIKGSGGLDEGTITLEDGALVYRTMMALKDGANAPARARYARISGDICQETLFVLQGGSWTKVGEARLERHNSPAIDRLAAAPLADIDARWTDYPDYLMGLIRSVQSDWRRILEQEGAHRTSGTVSLKFRLDSRGRIAAILDHSTSSTDASGTTACVAALTNRASYGDWTPDMIDVLGDSQELTLTFHYRFMQEPVVAAPIPVTTRQHVAEALKTRLSLESAAAR